MTPPTTSALLAHLSQRDLSILDDLEHLRLLSTRQLQRLHFPVSDDAHATTGAAARAASRVLTRLARDGLISHLENRIGGVRQGSSGYVWQLDAAGERLQRHRGGGGSRRRYREPNRAFMEHRTAVNDLAVTLREWDRNGHIELLLLEAEPRCWQTFTGPHGIAQTLKPDLHAVIARGDYENHFYVEIDLASEHLPQIVAKAGTYLQHAATGAVQHQLGIYPAVLWITTTRARALAMRTALRTDRSLPDGMHTVIANTDVRAHLLGEEPPG